MTTEQILLYVVFPLLVLIAAGALRHYAKAVLSAAFGYPRLKERVSMLETHDYVGLRQEVRALSTAHSTLVEQVGSIERRQEKVQESVNAIQVTCAGTNVLVTSIAAAVNDLRLAAQRWPKGKA